MNQTAKCHLIQGCKGLYIDAFRAFKSKTNDINATFILTHYHSDHYNGLPRGKKGYTGPALIHCTPITAELLKEIHGVDPRFIVPHPYGCTWTLVGEDESSKRFGEDVNASNRLGRSKGNKNKNNNNNNNIKITFYDANHCPGAAIIHIHIVDQDKHHIHTGDMRFHLQKFSTYTSITKAIEQRKIDLLYLDTTYSKPKHDFIPQDEAIRMISSNVQDLLKDNHDVVNAKKKNFFQPKSLGSRSSSSSWSSISTSQTSNSSRNDTRQRTLVLLSCYSIGKEKVLWHSAIQSNQKVYVNKTKYKMLQCFHSSDLQTSSSGGVASSRLDESCNIISKCTTNPHESDIHVIQMGLAGSLFPFFQPNYEQCALYAHELNKGYSKVVAFIPTGWANSSKFNKDNAISSKRIPMKDLKERLPEKTVRKGGCYGNDSSIVVEIRLIPYSEHSSYSELRSCVEFFNPRQIIPTVFSNDKEYTAIENRFRDLVDSHRAKANFIRMIGGGGSGSISSSSSSSNREEGVTLLKTNATVLNRKRKQVSSSNFTTNNDSTLNIEHESVSRTFTNSSQNLKTTTSTEHSFSKGNAVMNPYLNHITKKESNIASSPTNGNRRKSVESSKSALISSSNNVKQDDLDSHQKSEGNWFVTKKSKSRTKQRSPPIPFCVDEEKVSLLMSMGFTSDSAKYTLKLKRNNLEQAVERLLSEQMK